MEPSFEQKGIVGSIPALSIAIFNRNLMLNVLLVIYSILGRDVLASLCKLKELSARYGIKKYYIAY